MHKPITFAVLFVLLCVGVSILGMLYFHHHAPAPSPEMVQPSTDGDGSVNDQVNQLTRELGKLE